METFGDRLRKLRLERGWMIKDLATKTRIHNYSISCYERGKKLPSYWHLIELAVKLDCSLDYLMGIDRETTRTAVSPSSNGERRNVV
jgi:transcriptional regulator with XRE-family HTH domain